MSLEALKEAILMSRKNYTKYSNKVEENTNLETQENIDVEPSMQDTDEKDFVEEIKNIEDIIATGVVTSCVKLNIRKEPNKNSDVISVLDQGTEVSIDMSNSTEDFYKIITFDGLEGYCMKSFMAIK